MERGATATSIEDWQIDPIKNAIYRATDMKYAMFDKLNPSINRVGRITLPKRGLVLTRRNIETVDPFKNCYFSPVQCVFYEDRKK
uniref:LysM domain-containing protein n=1 Tax=Syphacia muris TaxID=451379 RepID=A0A0N5APH3_9BILA